MTKAAKIRRVKARARQGMTVAHQEVTAHPSETINLRSSATTWATPGSIQKIMNSDKKKS